MNARVLSSLEVHVQLTKTSAVAVNHLKLICLVRPNFCPLSQLFYTFTGHKLKTVYYLRLFTSRLGCLGVTMATIYVYAIHSVYFPCGCWWPLPYDIIIMQFTVVMIRRLFLTVHLHNITIQKSAYEDSDSDSDSDVSCVLSEVSSVSSYLLRKKGHNHEEYSEEKWCFWQAEIRIFFQDFQKLQEVWNIWQSKKNCTPKPLRTKDIISEVKMMKHLICVKITNNQRECSFEWKRSSPRNKRKIPSSPEETNKKKQNIKIDDFLQNASILPDGSDSQGIRSTKPAYQTSEETGNNDRKRKDQGNSNTAKRSWMNTTNSSSKKKKAEEEVRSVYNEGYYTDNINSDSLHQESEYQDITDDDNYQKNKKKKPNKKDVWSDKALEYFLETLREQPVKEMNDRWNKWIMFSKHLESNKKNRNDEEPLKKGKKGSALSHKLIPHYQAPHRKEG